METTNDPGNTGTGFATTHDFAAHIEKVMDSSNGTTRNEVDAETETTNEIEDVSNVFEKEIEELGDESADHTDETETETTDSEATAEPNTIRLKDGEFIEVNGERLSQHDLNDRLMIKAEFTRRTQELAKERAVYIQNQADLNAVRAQQQTDLANLVQVLEVEFEGLKQPDFNFLAENDPGEYVRQKAQWDRRVEAVRAIVERQEKIKAETAQYEAMRLADAQAKAREALIQYVPEFKDPAQAGVMLNKITSFLTEECGFTDEQVSRIEDPRLVVLAMESQKWRESQKVIPQVVKRIEQKPALTTPGSGNQRVKAETDGLRAAKQRLKNSGTTNAAAELFSSYFK